MAYAGPAAGAVLGFVQAHPIRVVTGVTSLALAPVLGTGWMIALPLKALGFGSAGVGAGTAAAWFQGTYYGGFVPAGGLFAAAQALGATVGL